MFDDNTIVESTTLELTCKYTGVSNVIISWSSPDTDVINSETVSVFKTL